MTPSVDLTALSWCLPEIRESLARAEAELDPLSRAGAADPARVRAARGWLHQAHGALQVVDLEGVSTVTGEAERLLDRIERGELAPGAEVTSALSRTFTAIVEFLDGLVAGSADSPVSLYPQYRDLLAAAGADRIEPADLYSADVSVRPPRAERVEPLTDAAAAAARGEFERGLLLFLRNPRDADGLAGMFAAIDRLNRAHQASAQRTFWWLAAAFFDALRAQALPVDLHSKRLVARVNLQIRRSLTGHGDPIPDRMLKDLLFLLARTGGGSQRADEARRLYRLAGTVPADFETPRYGLVDSRTLRAVREATAGAKAAWERFVRGGPQELAGFAAAAGQLDAGVARLPWPGLQRLTGTLVGLRRALSAAGAPLVELLALEVATGLLFVEQTLERGSRAVVQHDRRAVELAERLDRICERQRADDSAAPEWLAELSRAAQERLTTAAFVSELQANLRGCEQALDVFFREPAQRGALPALPPMLRQAAGALRLLGHDEAAAGAEGVAARVGALVESNEPLAPAECERVAASLGAIGFFVESLLQPGRAGAGFEFVRDGDGFVARLGDPPVRPTPASADDADLEPVAVQAPAPGAISPPDPTDASAAAANSAPEPPARPDPDPPRTSPPGASRPPAPGPAQAPPPSRPTLAAGAPTPPPTAAAPEVDPVDAELLEVFLGEAEEVLAAIDEHRVASQSAPSDSGHLTTIRRGFHTLKGSSRMVGLDAFGEAAWGLEQVLNVWLADERHGTAALYALITEAHREMSGWVARLRSDPGARLEVAALVARAASLRDGDAARTPSERALAAPAPIPAPTAAPATSSDAIVPIASEPIASEPVASEPVASEPVASEPVASEPVASEPVESPDALEAFLRRAAVAEPGEEVVELSEVLDPTALGESPSPTLDLVPGKGTQADAAPDGRPEVGEVAIGGRRLSAALYRIFLAEAEQLLARLNASVARWRSAPALPAAEETVRAAHSLAGTSRLVGLDGVHAIADALERFLLSQSLSGQALQSPDLDDYAAAIAGMHAALGRFAAGVEPVPDAETRARAESLAERWSRWASAEDRRFEDEASEAGDPFAAAPEDAAQAAADRKDDRPEVGARPPPAADAGGGATSVVAPDPGAISGRTERTASGSAAAPAGPTDAHPGAPARPREPSPVGAVHESLEGIAALSDEIDPDLAAVFIEEADELLPRIGEALRGWAAQPADPSLPASLMRLLHTVKGSARMAGAMRVGQLVHDMETRIESASALPRVPVALIDELIARCDQVLALYEVVRDPGSASAQAAARSVIDALTGQAGAAIGLAGGAVTDAQPSSSAGGGRGVPSGPSDPGASARPTAQPLIRVRADLLDRLVNEAGEVSIARARLDNALGGIRQSLSELTENVNRLRTQLREIELAADSQIQARNARNREEQHFDPLEFDRYTRFQELTRMLAESVSDVATVQQNALRHLDEGARDLGRQGQVTRDLQQDLMRIRMVPFGSVADRLYRVVRQAAKETDKRVSLDLKGATAELDRSVLERMVGPIEHLLRNAVVHGIEPRSGRLAAGKAETGELTLDVRQEANEVILSFADDGAGLNYPRIRARALERGLIDADAVLGERELAQLIFTPGFSTATEVTTLAGRGVGMDVVRAEVAAMGGRIDLQSTPGAGTRFTVYLPVSLAVTQVVLLTVGEVRIAVASALIEQVLQMQPEALAGAYARHQTEWQGEQVPLYFLGSVLELSGCTPLAQRYSPVVMLRSGHQRIALHVDHVAPSQEVVVKHVGPQLARLTGMAGATVLGNGEIVLILNPVQIVAAGRGAQAGQGDTASFAPTRIEIVPTVMVVDDSVTVRKVTQRLLVREGYQVILAKDGVDALRQLQDAVPDVMLLDVEMPRMDGFDLTRNIRGDERLRGIPIVMITSRTAEKHRSHALSLGVDVFLGKPYDEAEMLAHVKALAARRQHAAG